jgi:hypothetical protein
MADTIKTNAEILADQPAFLAAYQRACTYLKNTYQGVLGVGFGQKHTKGEYKNDIAILVYVTQKKAKEELKTDEFIPKYFEGYLLDVHQCALSVPLICDDVNDYVSTPGGIRGGIQLATKVIGGSLFSFGTLGCIVKRRQDSSRENVYVLSNKHVLWSPGSTDSDNAYHPFAPDMPQAPGNPALNAITSKSKTLGRIQPRGIFENVSHTPLSGTNPPPIDTFIDCATARVDIDCKCLGTTCTSDDIRVSPGVIEGLQLTHPGSATPSDMIKDVRDISNDPSVFASPGNQTVYKVGRTTGKTKGIIRAVNATILFDPARLMNVFGNSFSSFPQFGFNVIVIDFDTTSTPNGLNCKNTARFSEHGDSGSIVVDAQGRAVGMISWGSDVRGTITWAGANGQLISPASAADIVAACHIVPILDQLGICIPTDGGTSHGSSGATDGSGLTPAPTASGGGSGGAVFRSVPAPVFESPTTPDAQQMDRLNELREAFRANEKGERLYQHFAHIRREIGYLVRNVRPVTVAWHRNKGPAFFVSLLNHLKGDQPAFPSEIAGVQIETLLSRMETALLAHGSNQLREIITQEGAAIKQMLTQHRTAEEMIAFVKKISQ